MDLLSIKPNTVTVEIKHPATGAPIGLQIECVSLEDDRVKSVQRAQTTKALRRGSKLLTAEDLESNTVDLLSAAIVGWTWADGLTLGDLQNPALNKGNVTKLLKASWIAKQIDAALGDEAAFFTASASS